MKYRLLFLILWIPCMFIIAPIENGINIIRWVFQGGELIDYEIWSMKVLFILKRKGR